MSYVPSFLRSAALAAATLVLTSTPFLCGTTVASVATVTAVT